MVGDGSNYERELRDWFYQNEAVALRIPSSGSGTKRSLPDVLGRVGGYDFAIELKYTSGDYARFSVAEADDLVDFAELWGAVPCFVARFSYDTDFYAMRPSDLPDSWEDKNSFSISRKYRSGYPTLDDLIREMLDDDTREQFGPDHPLIQSQTA